MVYTIVIAAYNEADNIGDLTARIIATLDMIEGLTWHLIYVIEGDDRTEAIARRLADGRPEIKIIYNVKPSGLGNAFRQGFTQVPTESDVVITMDADLNHQPEEIPRLVNALHLRNADIVVGSRKVSGSVTKGAPFWKTAISSFVNRLMRIVLAMPVADQTSGYRVYRYPAFCAISFENAGFAFLPEILIRAHSLHLRIVEEPIQFVFRTAGESKMRLIPTARSYLSMIKSRLKQR